MSDPSLPGEQLRQLAMLHFLETGFWDIEGTRHEASADALKLMLRTLGVMVESDQDVGPMLRETRERIWQRVLEPVTVSWEGSDNGLFLRLYSSWHGPIDCRVELETGESQTARFWADDLPQLDSAEFGSSRYVLRRMPLPALPRGYHDLWLEIGGVRHGTFVISAPGTCFTPPDRRRWGVFAPLYGCHSRGSWGSGDIGDLRRLDDWVSSLGGSLVATLPMLGAFLDNPFEPSPYAPATRLFWNELYLDVTSIAELGESGAAAMIDSPDFREEIARLQATRYVDYAGKMKLMRRPLRAMSEHFWSGASDARRAALQAFVRERADVEDYARFRATVEKQRTPWHRWPASWASGAVPAGAWDEPDAQYHIYVQWLIDEQLREFGEEARRTGGGLYLDFPLGVHPDGYDVWREREVYVRSASVGAPPDSFFTRGQNWGFPPMHPDLMRERRYSYFIEAIRHHLRRAATLRIDHVMALHRLFWIPAGHEGDEGVYVRYREDELFAILCLESQRHQSMIVGEDLGTVPDAVRDAMNRHGVKRMYVLQYELAPDDEPPIRPVPEGIVASVNTHDMPTFASFSRALDVDDRIDLGLVDEEEARAKRNARRLIAERIAGFLRRKGFIGEQEDGCSLLHGVLAYLAASPAQTVIVNLEDLWEEELPQNVPGTSEERPNWRRKLRLNLEEITSSEAFRRELESVDRFRKEGRSDA